MDTFSYVGTDVPAPLTTATTNEAIPLPSQARLKELFDYDPETGVFTNRVNRGSAKAGDVAGTNASRGYRQIRCDGGRWLAHRLAWVYHYGTDPEESQVDHICGHTIPNANAITNLKLTDNIGNGQNSAMSHRNTSGCVGVSWNVKSEKWTAQIKVNRKAKYLGSFDDFNEAVAVRKQAERDYGFSPLHGLTAEQRKEASL